MFRRVLFGVAFVWWAATMYFVYNEATAAKPTILRELDIVVVGKLEKQEWFSIYWNGEKVGYSSKALQRVGTKLMVTEVTYLRLPVGGAVQEIYSQAITTVDSTLAVRSFSFDMQGGDYNVTAEGKVSDGVLTVVVGSPERTDTVSIDLGGEIYTPALLPEMIAQKPQKGLRIPTFDPFTMSRDGYEVTACRRERKKLGSFEGNVWVVDVAAMGFSSQMWISDEGSLIYEKGPGGFEQFRESQKEALSFELSRAGKTDILWGFSFPAQWGSQTPPRRARYGVYVLSNFPTEILELEDFNQRLRGDTLEVCAEGFEQGPKPTPADTSETPFIQRHDLRLIKAARKITSGAEDTLEMLVRINDYLYRNIKKEYQTSLPSAVDVLSKMKGDCNEHTVLFVGLARALGVPARVNAGVVYREDGRFFYHAWAQAYVGGRWHSFDPTFGQAPADAAHIKLVSGEIDKQIQLLRIGAKAEIKVVAAAEECP